MYIKSHDFIMF